ncbi:MAG: T9SS type A sorting domain-containing protein [Algibacter sp.]
MKKELQILFVLIFTSVSSQIFGQSILTYDLRCSTDGTAYEVYITRNTTAIAPLTTAASSRVTLVLPTGSRTVSHTDEGNLFYTALPAINNPGGIGNDYYGFSTSGGQSLIGSLTADVPTLWMTFIPSDGVDQDARLFINGTDPSSTDAGMNGVDLSNSFFTITIAGLSNEYNGNTNSIINCGGTLTVEEISLSSLKLYPNPAKEEVYIKGNLSDIKKIEIYDITGQLVKRLEKENLKATIYISEFESAVYFVKLYGNKGLKTIRLIKE